MNAAPSFSARSIGRFAPYRLVFSIAAVLAMLAMLLMPFGNAAGAAEPDPQPGGNSPRASNTEIQVLGRGTGQTVQGFLPTTPTTQDPTAGYPTTNPTTGYSPESSWAGTIRTASLSDPTLTAEMYCINIRVQTQNGVGYESGTWEESTIPNIGYVTYILNNYYPTTNRPTGLTNTQKAAAVQAAIWYFTDGFVLSTAPGPLRSAVAAIVQEAQTNGPVVEPPAPNVTITPTTAEAPVGGTGGPFVVEAENAAELTVSVPDGYALFADEAATIPVPNNSTVASGTSLWITSTATTANDTTLSARAAVTVQRGQVYIYDGNDPDLTEAQHLILAQTTELEAVAQATHSFFTVGSLTVNKTFAGDAVGQQGPIQLLIDCGEDYRYTAEIPANTTATQTFTYPGIPEGNTCTVTEPTTGSTTTVEVTTDAPQEATIDGDGETVTIANTVTSRPGVLNVTKVVTGEAAGSQEDIVLAIDCGAALAETFTIPAGSAAGSYVQSYTDLPAGTECTVTETATGESSTVVVDPTENVTVTITPGATSDATITNTATFQPGGLRVTKVVTGEAAGQQSAIVLQVSCGEALSETVTIPAGATADSYVQTFNNIPANTECTVTETETGTTQTALVVPTENVTVTVTPGTIVDATITNTVTNQPGSLNVTKVVTGEAAGSQEDIVLSIDCGEALSETFTIPAGSTADSYVQSYEDLPSGTECTITETETGESSTVLVDPTEDVTVTIEPGATATAEITNTVTFRPGVLNVTKVITGEAAGSQEDIVLSIDCGEALSETFTIPAGSTADSYVQSYEDLPSGTECTITETETGESSTVVVDPTEDVTVTIPPGEGAAAEITNTVTFRPGVLNVTKVITGEAAGSQEDIVLSIDCGE
ncbi:thioester domain-containing protein, partial [Mycetocola zhujimingii]